MSIGARSMPETTSRLSADRIGTLRDEGAEALTNHHHRILTRLASSDMSVGESMYREFYVFDDTYFAVEQRISICMQPGERGVPPAGMFAPFSTLCAQCTVSPGARANGCLCFYGCSPCLARFGSGL